MAGPIGVLNVEIGADMRNLAKGIDEAKAKVGGLEADTKGVGAAAGEAQGKFSGLHGAIVALGGIKVVTTLWGQLSKCVDAAIEFESAMAGVAKTTDLTTAELADMGEKIQAMSERIPIAAAEIAGVTEAAGQLGITGAQNLVNFTEVMSKLGVATDLTAEDAATMLAQFANITTMPTEQYENLGSTVVALGNASATTESKIVDMAQGMAAAGTNAGISEAAILGMAAAASSVGIEAAAGSTSWSKLISMIQTAVETGKDIEDWSNVAGMSVSSFSDLFRRDASRAIDAFIIGLKRMDTEGQSMALTLNDLGIKEIRLSRLVQSLANSNGLLTRELDLAADAWGQNIALNKEASTRFQTTESRVQMLNNRVTNLQQTIGAQLTPAYNVLVDAMSSAVKGIDEFFEQNQAAVPIVVGLTAALAGYVGVVGASAAGTAIKNTLISAGILIEKAAETQTYALNAAMLANPAVLVTAGIVGLVAALGVFLSTAMQASKEAKALNTSMTETRQASKDAQETFEKNSATLKANGQTAKNLARGLEELAEKTSRTEIEERRLAVGVSRLNELYPELGITVENAAEKIKELNSGMYDSLGIIDEVEAKTERYNELMSENTTMLTQNAEAQILLEERLAALTEEERQQYDALMAQAEAQMGQVVLMDTLGFAYLGASENVRLLVNDSRELNAAMKENTAQIAENEALMQRYQEDVAAVDQAYIDLGEAANALTDTEREHYNKTTASMSKLGAALDTLQQDYAETREEISATVAKIISGWKQVERSADVTTQSITAGYQSQITYMSDYMRNRDSLLDRDIDGLAEWVRAHDNASTESAGAFHSLAEASDDDIKAMLAAYEDAEKGSEQLKDSMASLAVYASERFAEIVTSAEQAAQGMEQSGAAGKAGRETIQGFVNAAEAMLPRVRAKYASVGKEAIASLRRAAEVRSPSRAAKQVGDYIGAGLIQGATDNIDKIRAAYAKAGKATVSELANTTKDAGDSVRNLDQSANAAGAAERTVQAYMDAAEAMIPDVRKAFAAVGAAAVSGLEATPASTSKGSTKKATAGAGSSMSSVGKISARSGAVVAQANDKIRELRAMVVENALPGMPSSVTRITSGAIADKARGAVLNLNMTLNAQRVTDAEAKRVAEIVSKKFATMTGGRVG